MKEIRMSNNGMIVLVDDKDYPLVNRYIWYAKKDRNVWYANSSHGGRTNRKFFTMHCLILDPPSNLQVDHINGNGLDNRRENMRLTNARGNGQNLHIKKTSMYPGVRIDKLGKKWQAQIKINGKQKHIGTFEREIDAAAAYNVACAVMGVTVANL